MGVEVPTSRSEALCLVESNRDAVEWGFVILKLVEAQCFTGAA